MITPLSEHGFASCLALSGGWKVKMNNREIYEAWKHHHPYWPLTFEEWNDELNWDGGLGEHNDDAVSMQGWVSGYKAGAARKKGRKK